MCGIAGLLSQDPRQLEARIAAMTAAISHRGPDGSGIWTDPLNGIALGHARLSIRDLTPAGAQPMISACQRFAITYNGEIYNADELKAAMPGRVWHGTSDTEILLEHCAAFGVAPTLKAANGMFAFALWDRESKTLTLARDRFGIKPLYWAKGGQDFLFASELRALCADASFGRDLDEAALAALMRLGYVPDPLSIWKAARKLEPGSLLTLAPGQEPAIHRWWDAATAIRAGMARQATSLAEETEELLQDAIRRQTVSDVPIGVFLSGGIDSSAVASHLAARTGGGLDSFTVSFDEAGYDESGYAKRIADHLGFRHHEQRLTACDALAIVPELARIYDEPFADSSQIPAVLISRFARQRVKVVLSGDGGDELFAGYNRHRFAFKDWPRLQIIPAPMRQALAGLVLALPHGVWGALGTFSGQKLMAEKMQKLAAILPLRSLDAAYDCLVGQGLLIGESPLAMTKASPYPVPPSTISDLDLHPLDLMQLKDIRHYLPGDILTKVDRASMACGLEVRVPLLDHRLIPLAFAQSPGQRFQDGQGKALLRRILRKRLPTQLFEGRPKQGFAVPIDEWLKGSLKDWAGDLLGRAKSSGLFDARVIDGWWADHQTGRRKRHHALWSLLMFQSWREER
ncbi:Asparagine synthetase [Rhodospirillaceae bacterium LM-1]|nr:Asparagine synthetase [Rhodospirillaceae bacterium LM-1]